MIRVRVELSNGHDERVFKARPPIQSAVPAAELIAFQNFQAWLTGISTLERVMKFSGMWNTSKPEILLQIKALEKRERPGQ